MAVKTERECQIVPNRKRTRAESFYQYGIIITCIAGMGRENFGGNGDGDKIIGTGWDGGNLFTVSVFTEHGTTEYRGISRYIPWRKMVGAAQH